MPTALIAEDEPLLAAGLQAELAKAWPDLEVLELVGDGERAVARALALRPDICFFDIRMPSQTGLAAAQALAEEWPEQQPFPLLVFVTAFEQYALAAFEQQAVDYLLKPVQAPRLSACVQRLRQRLAEREQQAGQALQHTMHQLRALLGSGLDACGSAGAAGQAPRLEVIQAQVGAIVHLVPVEQVLYFEAADKYVRVVTDGKEHLIRTSLRDLLPQLDPQRFWQVHRGTVVQARCITQARRDESGKVFLTVAGAKETLVVSRLYAHLFKGM
jgi:DNA-binding LytR/AlgR family response regulator